MKLVMIYDQIQAGAGTKDDKMLGLNITKERVGPAVMMESSLKEIDAQVLATLYCGNGYYSENKDEVIRKMVAMVQKIGADAVICGPSFNYLEFSDMCANVASELNKLEIPVVCAMSEENENVIKQFSKEINIVKCPKKGGVGLNQTLKDLASVVKSMVDKTEIDNDIKMY